MSRAVRWILVVIALLELAVAFAMLAGCGGSPNEEEDERQAVPAVPNRDMAR